MIWKQRILYSLILSTLLILSDYLVQAIRYIIRHSHIDIFTFTQSFWNDWIVSGFILCFLGFFLQSVLMSSRIFHRKSEL